ncbi:hypothetical protein R1sor_015926 [Riccia sorocarpa]|uniref:Uncharacterized protein n=1 Tax=Riccia sorocarpa TaxID=122646 RepID=A0ABD3HGB2_9MARC
MHPLIPDLSGTERSAEELHHLAVYEAYTFCHERELHRFWAYLWNEWYCPDMWKLFSRSSKPLLCMSRTTNIVEAHWRKIKHDYLNSLNRPRLDILVYLLAKKVLGDVEISLNQFQKGREFPTWWVKFRRQWVKLAEREPAARGYYVTDVSAWTYSCLAFVSAKYLICKHLVLGYTTGVSAEVLVYLQTYRRFEPPFYVFQSCENFFSRHTMRPESDPWYEQPAYVEHGMPEDIGIGGIDLNEDSIEMLPADDPETEDGGADEDVAAIADLLAEPNVSRDDDSAGEAASRGRHTSGLRRRRQQGTWEHAGAPVLMR